jgi:hypothetical protein
VFVVGELYHSFDVGGGTGESLENSTDVGTVLHANDAELIFLINPHEEGLVFVVEDTTAGGPVAVQTNSFEETVTLSKIG